MKKKITLFCFILACSFYTNPPVFFLCPRLGNHQGHGSCDVDNFSDPLFLIMLPQGSAASAALHLFGKSQPPPQTVDFPSCPRSGEQTPALVNWTETAWTVLGGGGPWPPLITSIPLMYTVCLMYVLYLPLQHVHSIILINFTKNMKFPIDVIEVEE